MGPIKLDPQIMNTMKTWGNNYNSKVGDDHDTCSDKVDKTIESKDVTINVMSKMDASHAKPDSMNPGVDKSFLAKAKPQTGTVGEGLLTRKLRD